MRNPLILSLLFFLFSHAYAADEFIKEHIPNAQIVGEGNLSVLFWDVYDATLYAPNKKWSMEEPFALTLSYNRDLSGTDIADQTIEEMRKQGVSNETLLAQWNAQMKEIFPDIKEGKSLTGIYTKDGETRFYHSGVYLDSINQLEFSKAFFDIWLAENTSEPDLRRKLLGP